MRSQQEVAHIVDELCSGLTELFPQSAMDAILFGSYARGDAESGSDIDVMVLVDSSRAEISDKSWQIGEVAASLLLEHGVVVAPIVEERAYFHANAGILPLYRNILAEGVRLGA